MKITLTASQLDALAKIIDDEQAMFTQDPKTTPPRVMDLREVLKKLTEAK